MRKFLASALALGLVFTLTPAAMSWAGPDDEPVDSQLDSDAPASDETGDEAGDDTGSEGSTGADFSDLSGSNGDEPIFTPFADGDAILTLTLDQITGTEPFQADDAPGNDSSATNTTIRTNDTITYNLGIRYEGEDQTAPTVTFELPRGQELLQLPPFCLTGSSVTPNALPAPETPLTSTSWETLPRQTVTCVLKDETMGTSLNYAFIAQVRSEVPNGTVMDEVTFEATSEQLTDPATIAPAQVTVSALASYDISKRIDSDDPARGWMSQSGARCPAPYETEVCRIIYYPVTITTPAGGKGVSPLQDTLSFIENLDPASFYGPTVWAQMVAVAGSEAAASAAYGPQFRSISKIGQAHGSRGSLPYGKLYGNFSTETNSVRESGDPSFTAGDRGEPTTITITGMDTTATTTPSTTGTGNALPSNLGFVASFELSIAIPQAAVLEFGEENNGSFTLDTHNEYVDFQATSIDGASVTDADLSNNDRDATIRVERGQGLNKAFTGIPGAEGNTPASSFAPGWAANLPGSTGSGSIKDGNTVVMPGQAVYSLVTSTAMDAGGTGNSSTMVTCDVWDADRLSLASHPDWNGSNPTTYPGNNRPVFPVAVNWESSNRPASVIGDPTSGIHSYTVEYSSGAGGPGADADCSTGTWSANPDDIGSSSVDAQGRTVWNGINRVRITWVAQFPVGTTMSSVNFQVAIGLVVKDGDSSEPIGNWASQVFVAGTQTTAEAFADPAASRSIPNYDPETHRGSVGDRLWQGDARVRIHKLVENPLTGEFVDTAVPQYTSGSAIRYRLDPSLTGDVTVVSAPQQVTIEECLPLFQIFESATQGATALTPTIVQMGAPTDAEMSCDANRQYVKFDLGELPVGVSIEPIVVAAEILDVAGNGLYTNDVVIASPADSSPIGVRSDQRQMQLVVPTGVKISKTVNPGVIEVNPADVTTPRTLTWSVYFANIDNPTAVSNVDVIDVLPANGLNGNVFTGTLRFESATAVAGDNIAIWYTKTAAADLSSDPGAATNEMTGATLWCDAASGGTLVNGNGTGDDAVDCPQLNEEVTGLRFTRPGVFAPSDPFQIDILMTPIGNHSGDVYRNVTSGLADGVSQGVGPARRDVQVIASQVGDFVWNDLDGNGVQDTGEPGVAGVTVTLTGTDVDGNTVTRTTTTGPLGEYLFEELASGNYRVTFDISSLTGYVFTDQGSGADPTLDSDADPATGMTAIFALGRNSSDPTIDAGVIQQFGALVINKLLEGAGVQEIAAQDELTFNVTCTLAGDPVFEDDVTLQVNGQAVVTSDEITPIPAGAECVVTETDAGSADADALPDPVTVLIPWNPTTGDSGTVTASLTNYYSAGTIQITKTLAGDTAAMQAVRDVVFEVQVTCQIEEPVVGGDPERVTLYSGVVKLKGGQTKQLTTDAGDPQALPLGTTCFAAETVNGGADSSTVDHDSFENGVTVTAGTPLELQELTITVVNTFTDEPGLPTTGGRNMLGAGLLTGGLLLAGALLLLARRMRA